MSAQLRAIVAALTKSHAHALDAAAEAATIAACADGYRGPLWVMIGEMERGCFEIVVTRTYGEMIEMSATRTMGGLPPFSTIRQIEITEDGAQAMLHLILKTEGGETAPEVKS